MAWGDNGVTIQRQLLDQQAVATSWGASILRVPFRALRTAGYLRRLRFFVPNTTMTITHGTGTSALQANGQLTPERTFNRAQLVLQGIAPLYDVEGLSLPYIRAMNAGDVRFPNWGYLYDRRSGSINVNAAAGFGSSASFGSFNGTLTANTSFIYTYMSEWPIAEKITFKDSVIAQKSGSVVIADKPMEIGILTLQNTQSNVQPTCTLNPLYTQTAANPDAQLQTTGNDTSVNSPTFNISSDLYDVPDVANQRPLPWQQAFVITRQDFDTPVSGGAATVNFKPAGFLVRVVYRIMDANNNLLDVSIAGATVGTGTIDFKWGATVSKFTETFQENISRQLDRSVGVPLFGALYDDFHYYDGSATDFVNTAILPNVRAELKGLTGMAATATTVRTNETRMIPVKVS